MPEKLMPDAQKVGDGRMSFMFWDVYDATLYAPSGGWSYEKPFALKLNYLMELSGDDIAERSIEEMRKQGFEDEMKLAAWYSQMREIFPDVKEGCELTGFYVPGKQTRFYYHDKPVGSIHDPEFGKWFFGIWLSENTTDTGLRKQLLGQK